LSCGTWSRSARSASASKASICFFNAGFPKTVVACALYSPVPGAVQLRLPLAPEKFGTFSGRQGAAENEYSGPYGQPGPGLFLQDLQCASASQPYRSHGCLEVHV
jgi:hypothetical protein